jgi:hypothetical protein
MNPISNHDFTRTNYDMSPKHELFSISKNILSLDECIDNARACSEEQFSITSLIRGHGKPKKKKRKRCNLKPIVYVRFNTSLGKPKPARSRRCWTAAVLEV